MSCDSRKDVAMKPVMYLATRAMMLHTFSRTTQIDSRLDPVPLTFAHTDPRLDPLPLTCSSFGG